MIVGSVYHDIRIFATNLGEMAGFIALNAKNGLTATCGRAILLLSHKMRNTKGGGLEMDVQRLREAMKKRGETVTSLAEKVQMHPSTLYRKLKDAGEPITLREAGAIREAMGLSGKQAAAIFFAADVACDANEVDEA